MNIIDKEKYVSRNVHLNGVRPDPKVVEDIYALVEFLKERDLMLSWSKHHVLISRRTTEDHKQVAQAVVIA